MIFFSIPCLVFPSSSRFFRAVTPKRTMYRALFLDASSHLYKMYRSLFSAAPVLSRVSAFIIIRTLLFYLIGIGFGKASDESGRINGQTE